MKKVLLVSNYYSYYVSAGTSKRTREIKKGLSKQGWECKVLTIKRKNFPVKKEPDYKDINAIGSFSEKYPIPFFFKRKVFDLIKSSDVVHIINNFSLLNILSIIFCLISKTPYIYSPCGALTAVGKNIFIKKIYNLFFLNMICKNASYIFAITKKELEEINNFSQTTSKTILLPNGIWKESKKETISVDNYKLSKMGLPAKYILFVGRLSVIKGPDILLEAFLKSKIKYEFSLIYAGPDENMKKKMLNNLKKNPFKNNIIFLGSVSSEKRDFLMKNAFLTVIPSRKEAMSMVALESSLMGTPFLASQFCGLDDFEENSSGYICKGDSESISLKLDFLLKDIDALLEVGENAHNYVLSSYTWESIIDKMDSYLKRLINK